MEKHELKGQLSWKKLDSLEVGDRVIYMPAKKLGTIQRMFLTVPLKVQLLIDGDTEPISVYTQLGDKSTISKVEFSTGFNPFTQERKKFSFLLDFKSQEEFNNIINNAQRSNNTIKCVVWNAENTINYEFN